MTVRTKKIYTEYSDEQLTPKWWSERRGIPTSSQFGRIITPQKLAYASGRKTYAAELIASRAGGWRPDFKGNDHTERGHLLEDEARRWLRFRQGIAVRKAGFCLHESKKYGGSPDGFTESGDPVEIKSVALNTFCKWMIEGGIPQDHLMQLEGHMVVTGADRVHFVAYADCEHIDNYYAILERSERTEKVKEAVEKFCDELESWQRKLTGDEYEVIWG